MGSRVVGGRPQPRERGQSSGDGFAIESVLDPTMRDRKPAARRKRGRALGARTVRNVAEMARLAHSLVHSRAARLRRRRHVIKKTTSSGRSREQPPSQTV